MDLGKVLEIINKDRNKDEACFVFSLWKDPELYADYMNLNTGNDKTLKDKDAIFYYKLGRDMYKNGFRTFDGITLDTYLSTRPKIEKRFNEYGGMHEVEQLKSLIHTDNVDGYFDAIAKKNSLSMMAEKYEEIFDDVGRFDDATNEDVYNAFDLLNSSIALATGNNVEIEDLTISDDFLEDCDKGSAKGLDYSQNCPVLNYITLGIPLGEMTMFAGHSGVGKSSFLFENVVLPLNQQGVKVAVISNEMRSKDYKMLLLIHILTHDLGEETKDGKHKGYWDLTRKKIKMGGFSDEQWEMLRKAKDISKSDQYNGIRFVKMFENEASKTMKYMRKLACQGYQVIVWDTMKSDDVVDEIMWQSLMVNSRRIFQIASKNNIAIVPTYQLALSTSNQRFLDAGCLSNSKQIKEVFSEMLLARPLWQDEYSGEKHDVKPYTLKKEKDGTWKRDESIQLDPTKRYMVVFVEKTRNDEDRQQVLYEFNGRYNIWREIGRCVVINDHSGR